MCYCSGDGDDPTAIRELFKLLVVQDIEEAYDESRVIVGDPTFTRFGLADTAIAAVCSRGILVLTTDVQLQLALQARDIDALKFNHIRPLGW